MTPTEQVLVTPDGKTVYVLDSSGAVTPISTATHRPGQPIELPRQGFRTSAEMAITPDGKTLYVCEFGQLGSGPSYVIPIATATNRPGKPIAVPSYAVAIVITPDGRTIYVIGQPMTGRAPRVEVTPIATGSDRPGRAIIVGTGLILWDSPVATTPDGHTIYIGTRNGVIPFSTVANTPGKPISFGAAVVKGIAIAPDGSTAYVLNQPPGSVQSAAVSNEGDFPPCTSPLGRVTPIATATEAVGTRARAGHREDASASEVPVS